MYVCMGGESAARSTLCIESIVYRLVNIQEESDRTGDVGVAIGQLRKGQHNKRQ